ncbi:MAG: alpha/beta hydrolase-fold protein, partial [Bacteroidetes bacterium]|nr:alpha/beta hydrolase-fold protein [Bacteroidota bacterium]
PELFTAAAPLSARMGPQSTEELTDWAKRSGAQFNEDKAAAYLEKNNPLYLAKTLEPDALNRVRWYIDCGDDDFLYEGNSQMHVLLKERGVNHEYRVRDGGHTWTYWRTALPTVLKFITESFHQK